MEKQDRPAKFIDHDAPPSIYANNAEINVTLWDFRFKFGEIEKISEEGITVTERARIAMSPQHAKVFSRVLNENLSKYEEMFGEITIEAQEGAKTKSL